MSFEYQNFATLGLNLNRQKYGPLDISSVFNNIADLNYYLSKGTIVDGVSDYWKNIVPYPHAGQIVALVNEDCSVQIYALTEKADGTFTTFEIGEKIDLSIYSTTEQMMQAIENAVNSIDLSNYVTKDELPEDKDTRTKIISGDNYIDVIGDYAEDTENVFTININTDTLKALIGAETTAAMEFKGAIKVLPENALRGDVYKAAAIIMVPPENDAEGYGFATSIGDSIVADGTNKWYLIPSGDDIEDTWRPVTKVANSSTLTFNAGAALLVNVAEDGNITYSHATINDLNIEEDQSASRKYITGITTDDYGHITGYSVAEETVEDTNDNDTYSAGAGINISEADENSNHIVSIKLVPVEKNLSITENGLATNFNLEDYATNAEAKANNGIRYINQSEIDKLSKLTLDGEDITISGSVEASQVKNLYSVVKSIVTSVPSGEDYDADTEGIQTALGIEIGAERNYINSVSEDFVVVDGYLSLNNDYVTTKIYEIEVGDLNKLSYRVGATSTLVDEINDINARLTWINMDEN